jgi:hypothetical protein
VSVSESDRQLIAAAAEGTWRGPVEPVVGALARALLDLDARNPFVPFDRRYAEIHWIRPEDNPYAIDPKRVDQGVSVEEDLNNFGPIRPPEERP